MLIFKNFVICDGKKLEIDVCELVVGDLVNLEVGDVVFVDMCLILVDNFNV